MSEGTHTSGPWEANLVINQMDHPGSTVAVCGFVPPRQWMVFSSEFPGDEEADARLIAAAPDLLEACKLSLFYSGGPMRNETKSQRVERLDVCARTKAAIAKAEATP